MPGANEIEVRFFRVGGLQSSPLRHVSIGNSHKTRRPLILIPRVNGLKSLAHIVRIETNERVGSYLRAMDCLGLDFIESPLPTFLAECRCQ